MESYTEEEKQAIKDAQEIVNQPIVGAGTSDDDPIYQQNAKMRGILPLLIGIAIGRRLLK